MAQKMDLRQIFVKTKLNNTDNNGKSADSSFDTTDIAYLPSVDEIKNIPRERRPKSLTDYTILNDAQQSSIEKASNGKLAGNFMLRSNCGDMISRVDEEGQIVNQPASRIASTALSIALNIDVNSLISMLEKSDDVKIISKQLQGREEHYVALGAFPKQILDKNMQIALEEAFNEGDLADDLTCTGLLYETFYRKNNSKNFLLNQNPEFEYKGEKYVRAKSNIHSIFNHFGNGEDTYNTEKYVWLKVEPILLKIQNWDELPTSINPNGKEFGSENIIKTETDECILSGVPFSPDDIDEYRLMWQNSFVRAFLNSAKSSDLDGNPNFKALAQWDFSKSGFLYQAFDMTREPTREYTIPKTEKEIASYAFAGCVGIEKIIIPPHLRAIGNYAFEGCKNIQLVFENLSNNLKFNTTILDGTNFKYIYLSKDGDRVIFSPKYDETLEKTCIHRDFVFANINKVLEKNYRENTLNTLKLKENGKIKFIPPEYTLQVFPASEIEKYFINNNNKRWARLVKTLGFDSLEGIAKTNSLTDLMKIYYAIGGFSENQGECERAYEYILKYVATGKEILSIHGSHVGHVENPTPSQIGEEIHARFSKLQLKGPYNPEFAKFFMKYYKDDPGFMVFDTFGRDKYWKDKQDYLCAAHNNFAEIQKAFPNRVVNGNEKRALLTPEFVAEHCSFVEYNFVDKGNEELANLVGRCGYSEEQFDHIQYVYNKAKTLKDKYVISADKAEEENGISFRILKKDDPLGFVLGDITNCCQHVGGGAESCVDDGYLNPEAGFLVFEESILDENGNSTDEKRILGQSYVWYDPETKTVCYDNIEIPTVIREELQKGDRHNARLSYEHLMDAVVKSAEMVMLSMNARGIKVERVTTGRDYNKLATELKRRFGEPELHPKARHRNYTGYTDAKNAQYVIKDIKNEYSLGFVGKKIGSEATFENFNDGHENS